MTQLTYVDGNAAAAEASELRRKQLTYLDGNAAAAEAFRLARVQVVAAYPITPQSPIAESLASSITQGILKAEYIRVESEHTAMSCCVGAALTGVRACTATSSVGLALMHELLGVAAGLRMPIVMGVVNRELAAPWSLWCGHGDAMAERDTGWMQLYAENPQEVLDFTLMAYRIAEHPEVMVPCMVNQDGFFVSHTGCAVAVPEQGQVDEFIPAYTPSNLVLDPDNPMFINPLTMSDEFMEVRYQQKVAFDNIMPIMLQVMDEFEKKFGRKYAPVQFYRCDDAEEILVTLGSMSGTAEFTVDRLRAQGQKVGLAKIVSFRPFPSGILRERLAKVPHIGVVERAASFGAGGGPVLSELRSALANTPAKVSGFVAGLGGRDIQPSTFIDVVNQLRTTEPEVMPKWLNVRPDAMQLREFVQR